VDEPHHGDTTQEAQGEPMEAIPPWEVLHPAKEELAHRLLMAALALPHRPALFPPAAEQGAPAHRWLPAAGGDLGRRAADRLPALEHYRQAPRHRPAASAWAPARFALVAAGCYRCNWRSQRHRD
jgi:hypothetical protein